MTGEIEKMTHNYLSPAVICSPQYLLGTEVSSKMHHTRKSTIHRHMFQTNIWSSKLLQPLFYSIHGETIELITMGSSEH